MKHLLALMVVFGCSCLEFDSQLNRCRDAGVWICGGAKNDAGFEDDAGPGFSDAGVLGELACNQAWCWDHPRPTGVTLRAVWGTSANDVWVAGDLGTLLHFDGTHWQSYDRPRRYAFTSICGHGSTVYAGAMTGGGTAFNRLLRWDGSSWSEVEGTREDIHQLACGPSALFIAEEGGASSLNYASSQLTRLFTLAAGSNEYCTAISDREPGACVVGCMAGGGSGAHFVRVRSCDGGLEFERQDDAGVRGNAFGVRALWTDSNRGVLAAISGSPAEIWQLDAGWAPAWTSVAANENLYSGAPTPQGSIAVGATGVVVDVNSGGASSRSVTSALNSYHYGVWAPPSGDPWMVGEIGCIQERDAGSWIARSACAVQFEDFSVEPLLAITDIALYRHGAAGWELAKSLPAGQRKLWAYPDGGIATLSASTLRNNVGLLPTGFDDAIDMYVVSEDRVVIARANGELVDTNLRDGAATRFDAGVRVSSLSGEADGTVWATGPGGLLMSSNSAGTWSREDLGFSGDISELSTGFGRQWFISGDVVATRLRGGTWSQHTLTQGAFQRVVAIDAENALLFRDENTSALRVSSSFVVQEIAPPPSKLGARIVLRGDELWARAWEGGVLRFPFR